MGQSVYGWDVYGAGIYSLAPYIYIEQGLSSVIFDATTAFRRVRSITGTITLNFDGFGSHLRIRGMIGNSSIAFSSTDVMYRVRGMSAWSEIYLHLIGDPTYSRQVLVEGEGGVVFGSDARASADYYFDPVTISITFGFNDTPYLGPYWVKEVEEPSVWNKRTGGVNVWSKKIDTANIWRPVVNG